MAYTPLIFPPVRGEQVPDVNWDAPLFPGMHEYDQTLKECSGRGVDIRTKDVNSGGLRQDF